jgi:hypothetical protein
VGHSRTLLGDDRIASYSISTSVHGVGSSPKCAREAALSPEERRETHKVDAKTLPHRL